MTVALSSTPVLKFFDNNGAPLFNGQLFTYQAGTTTPQATWPDSTQGTPNPNPVILNARGECNLWLDISLSYKLVLKDAAGNQIWSVDNVSGGPVLTAGSVGAVLFPPTPAEQATGLTLSLGYPYGDIRRYGLIPNSVGAATANTTFLTALWNPANGVPGQFRFPNTTGTDTYYLNGMIQLRDGVSIDLNGCTLNFTKSWTNADNTFGFLNFIRDTVIQNGSITVNYSGGSSGVNPGAAIRIGSRSGYPYGSYAAGIFDQDDLATNNLPLMGDIRLSNLYISSNNPTAACPGLIFCLGGLRNVVVENVHFDGQGVAPCGFYYEFGFASKNGSGTESNWTSSHGCNLILKNLHAQHLDTSASQGGCVQLVGAHHAVMENIVCDHAVNVINYTVGEALFYRPWAPTDVSGGNGGIVILNPVGSNITGVGLVLGGASANTGYLGSVSIPDSKLRDLMSFKVTGGSISANGSGIQVSGDCEIDNCHLDGSSSSGQIVITDDVRKANIHDCKIIGSSGAGIRAFFTGQTASVRFKTAIISNCLIAGNSIGINVANSEFIKVTNCQIGYNSAYDAAGESVQSTGISVSLTSQGGAVLAEGCLVTTNSGTAYSASGSGTNNAICGVIEPKGEQTFSGTWSKNGVTAVTNAVLTDKTSIINTADKWLGRLVINSTNNKMYAAQGSTNTSTWIATGDGTTTITPV